jgi:hemerythrin superfamily protein
MPKSIESLMLGEHDRLKNLLNLCLENLKHNPIVAEENFIKFKWNMEKHFFLEEKIIFSNPAVENSEHSEEVEDILEDHKQILGFIKKIEEDKSGLHWETISELKKLVEKHAELEDEDFYPRLDEILTLEQKQEMIRESKKVLEP